MSLGVQNPIIEDQLNRLFSEILMEQQKVEAVKSADPEKTKQLDQLLEKYAKHRGRGFFFQLLASGKGHGPFTELLDGSVKYDLVGSMGVNLLGHSHPLYIKAALESATMDTNMVGNLHIYPDSVELTESIVNSVSNTKLKHFWFAGSGSFANDNALKMIWQKSNGKKRILALEKCFAGRSIATQDITHNQDYKKGMPTNLEVDYFSIPDSGSIDEIITKTIENLNQVYNDNGKDACCITLELVQGEGGFNIYPSEVYRAIFDWAKDQNLFIWVDEIQSFGRTGQLFAFQTLGLEDYPDIVTVGKALQVCGTLYSEELNPEPGLIAGTFQGSLTSIKAGISTLRYLSLGNFFGDNGRIIKIRNEFEKRLKTLSDKNDFFGESSGIGLMFAFQVGNGDKETTSSFIKRLFENGIISFSCGKNPYKVRFLLPLCLNDDHFDEVFEIIEKSATSTSE